MVSNEPSSFVEIAQQMRREFRQALIELAKSAAEQVDIIESPYCTLEIVLSMLNGDIAAIEKLVACQSRLKSLLTTDPGIVGMTLPLGTFKEQTDG